MRKRSVARQIDSAAKDVMNYLRRQCGGDFYRTPDEWESYAGEYDIKPIPLWNVRGAFTAMAYPYQEDKWYLLYNAERPPLQIIGFIVHELAEIICASWDRCLWECWPYTPIYHYDGGDDPQSIRHRAAQLVEKRVMHEIQAQK